MKENIIFTTKGLYNNSNVIIAFVVYAILATIMCFTMSMYSLVFWLLMILFIIPYTRATCMKKSYIELYEDHVVGFSVPDNIFSGTASEFKLDYTDITHVEIQQDTVKIYFNGGSYLVQAKGEENTVNKIIQEHKTGYNQ